MALSPHIQRSIERLQSMTIVRDESDHLPFFSQAFDHPGLNEAVLSLDSISTESIQPPMDQKAHAHCESRLTYRGLVRN